MEVSMDVGVGKKTMNFLFSGGGFLKNKNKLCFLFIAI
jgi:hypothetical protein